MKRTFTATLVVLALVTGACGDDTVAAQTTAEPGTTATTTTAAPAATTTVAASGTTAGTSATSASGCPTADFQIDRVNAYQPAAGIPDPQLSVTCGTTTFTVTSNDIPDFEFVQVTPNALQAQNFSMEIPLTPTVRSTPGAIGLGPIGVTVNGLAMFGAFEAPQATRTRTSTVCSTSATATRRPEACTTSMPGSTASSTTRTRWGSCTATWPTDIRW